MDDLPPPPPLPSLNESICNDFPSPPFIEMMGNMTVDRGTPLEGPQPNDPLPFQPRLPLESVQMVPTCMTRAPFAQPRRLPAMVSSKLCKDFHTGVQDHRRKFLELQTLSLSVFLGTNFNSALIIYLFFTQLSKKIQKNSFFVLELSEKIYSLNTIFIEH